MSKHAAVYSISHPKSTKVYIGSSSDIKRRWRTHRRALERNAHQCRHLQHAWNKYGGGSFVFLVLEDCSPVKEQLLAREQHWMDHCRPTGLYNTCPTAGSPLGSKLTAQQRKRISVALKGKPKSNEHRGALKKAWETREPNEAMVRSFAVNRLGKNNDSKHNQNAGAGVKAYHQARRDRGEAAWQGKRCTFNDANFLSLKAAAEATGMPARLLRKHPDFSYVNISPIVF
jgi:group I intron endonuclease